MSRAASLSSLQDVATSASIDLPEPWARLGGVNCEANRKHLICGGQAGGMMIFGDNLLQDHLQLSFWPRSSVFSFCKCCACSRPTDFFSRLSLSE
jgi:hypothetical protein